MTEHQMKDHEFQKKLVFDDPESKTNNKIIKNQVTENCSALDFEGDLEKHLDYLKDIFIKSCIEALESKVIGAWIHFLEILTLLKPFSEVLSRYEQIFHYLVRVYDFSQQNEHLNHLNIPSTLIETFPNLNSKLAITTSISMLNAQSPNEVYTNRMKSGNVSFIKVTKEPYLKDSDSILKLNPYDLGGRIYEPKKLSLIDIQRFLPRVVSDIVRLECTWNNALGLTVTSLNTDLPQEIYCERSFSLVTESSNDTVSRNNVPTPKESKSKRIKTGRDIIERLVKSGRHKVVQIFYLNLVPSVLYNPYNLILATKSTIKKEHVVMSVFGVLHVRQNGNSDLTPLGQWYMEAVCFETMKNIKFFKYFHLIKSLKKWKCHLKYSRFLKTREQIQSSHLYSIPSVSETMLKINHLIMQMDDIKLFPHCEDGQIEITNFEDFVFTQLRIGGKIFQRLFSLTLNVLNKCHVDCINYYQYCQEQVNVEIQPKESLAISRRRKEKQQKNKKIAEQHLIRFTSVVKLITTMVMSKIVCKLSKHIDDFIHKELFGNKNGYFYCVLQMCDTKISLQPTENDFCAAIVDTFNSCLVQLETTYFKSLNTTVNSFAENSQKQTTKALIGLDMLKSILEINNPKLTIDNEQITLGNREEDDTIDVQSQDICIKESVLAQPIIRSAFALLKKSFSDAYKEVQEFLQSYSWVEEVVQFVGSWNSKQFEEETVSLVSSVECNISRVEIWQINLGEMNASYITKNKLVLVELTSLSNKLLPKLQAIFMEMIEILTWQNSEESRIFFNDLNDLCEKLSVTPSDVEGFTKYFVFVNEVQAKEPTLKNKMDHIKALYDLIKHCHRQLTDEEEKQEEKMWLLWEKFIFELQNGTSYMNAELPFRVKQLKNDIKELLDKADSIVAISNSGEFLKDNKNVTVVLSKLKKRYEEFNRVYEKLQRYVKCSDIITGVEVDLEGLEDGKKKIHSRYELWNYLELSCQKIKGWKQTAFSKFQVSIKKILEKVQNWNSAMDLLELKIPKDDLVFTKWLSVVEEFNESLVVLQELANPALKKHHWKEIFVILGQVYDPTATYRVDEIVSMDIINNAKKIRQISVAASAEHALEQCLQNLIKQWEKKDFKFKKDGTNEKQMRNATREVKRQQVRRFYVLTGIDELIDQLEDSLVTLQSMLVSPHVTDVKDLANQWNTQLQETKQILEIWMSAQHQWVYLGQIFASETSKNNHPLEYKIFVKQDAFFKELIEVTIEDSKVLHVLKKKGGCKGFREYQGERLKELLLQAIQEQSEAIKGLSIYLSEVQTLFPRLYFWSKEELIHLLTVSYNPKSLLPVAQKCFPGVHDVKFEMPVVNSNKKLMSSIDTHLNSNLLEAVGVQGNFDEVLTFEKALPSDMAVVDWLNMVADAIRKTMKNDLEECIVEIEGDLVGCKIDYMKWRESNLHRRHSFQTLVLYYDILLSKMLKSLSDAKKSRIEVRDSVFRHISNFASFIQTTKWSSTTDGTDKRRLVLVQTFLNKAIHFKDRLPVLESCSNKNSFEWLQTILYHWNQRSEETEPFVQISCFGYEFDYGYEYQGVSHYIVCTPFTDRYTYAILVAMQQYQVGCLFGGSAGNGKSAICSHISKILGRHFVTLNCTHESIVSTIGQYLHGALRVGSLLCIDQISKLSLEVLSVTAQFFEDIRQGLMKKMLENKNIDNSLIVDDDKHHMANDQPMDGAFIGGNNNSNNNIMFNGQFINVNSLYGCVYTTNQNVMRWKAIPDNLRRNLHPISVRKPNLQYIFEAWFRLNGFHNSKTLAEKLQTVLTVFDEEDKFSISRIKNVISLAAQPIYNDRVESDQEMRHFVKTFLTVFKSSVSKTVFTKLLFHVGAKFSLGKDSLVTSSFYDALLTEAVKEQITADNLYPYVQFTRKVLELHKILTKNQSVIIYGSRASGKTTCYKTLARALCQFYSPWSQQQQGGGGLNDGNFSRVNLKVVYPNVMDSHQLYGNFDCSSQTWNDGLLTKLLSAYPSLTKTSSSTLSTTMKGSFGNIQPWLVLDGSINNQWLPGIEALLDQQMQSTSVLQNGRQVYLDETSKVLFEVDSLASCSPSLLTKSATLYCPPKLVGWKGYFHSWKKTAHSNYLITYEKYPIIEEALAYTIVPCANFIHEECDRLLTADVHTTENLLVDKGSTYITECTHILHVLSALLYYWIPRDQVQGTTTVASDAMDEGFITKFLCNAVSFAFAHSMAALVHTRSYPKLDIFIRQIFSTCPPCPVIFPSNFLDCYFDGNSGELKPWNEQKARSRVPMPSSSFTVTKEIQQCYMLTELLVCSQKNCLLIGDVAAGKSSFVKSLLSMKHSYAIIKVSNSLNVKHFQKLLLDKTNHLKSLQTTKMKLMKAKNVDAEGGEKMLFFIDDMNVAEVKEYGQQQPFYEYIRQLNAEGGCYDGKGSSFHYLPFLQMLVTYTPPSFDELSLSNTSCLLTSKFLRHFSIIRYPTLANKDLNTVYNKAIQSWLGHFDWLPWKQAFSKAIVSATIDIHLRLRQMFSPSISLLYKFSLHDLAKVFRNLVCFKPSIDEDLASVLRSVDIESLADKEQYSMNKSVFECLTDPPSKTSEIYELLKDPMKGFLEAWCNEMKYVYGKRFSLEEEKTKLYDVITEEIRNHFECDSCGVGGCVEDLEEVDRKELQTSKIDVLPQKLVERFIVKREEFEIKSTAFFLHSFNEIDNIVVYKRCHVEGFQDMVLDSLKELELKLFINEDILDHIASLTKAMTSGHALLVSSKGHGRKNAVKVAARLLNMQMFELPCEITMIDSKMIIKDACNAAGLNGKPIVLYASDMLPKDAYEYLATLMCDGMCPGLYTANELVLTCSQLLPGGHLNMWKSVGHAQLEERFFQRIKANLHIVVAKSHVNIKSYLQKYPIVLHKMTCIDVYREYTVSIWSDFASQWFSERDMKNIARDPLSALIAQVHCLATGFTNQDFNGKEVKLFSPLQFFECLEIFHVLYDCILVKKNSRLAFLETATTKVGEAKTEIVNTCKEIEKATPMLEKATKEKIEAEGAMKESQSEYLKLKHNCNVWYRKIAKLKETYEDLKRIAGQYFDQLSPLYDAAVKALGVLDYHAVDELKSYSKPPEGVIFVAEMLCVLFDIPHQGWEDSKLLLMRDNFLQDLQFFDKDNISEKKYKKLCEFVSNPAIEHIENVSKAADQLKIWLQAIHSYATIFRQVEPKKIAMKVAESDTLQAEKQLCDIKLHCSDLKEEVERKKSTYKIKVQNAQQLQDKIKEYDAMKSSIRNLIETLKAFSNDWESEIEDLQKEILTMPQNCLLMTVSIVYLGVYPPFLQNEVKQKWASVSSLEVSSDFSLSTILSTMGEQREWLRQIDVKNPGLVEKLLRIRIVSESSDKCWPFLIDPYDVAEKYVRLIERVHSGSLAQSNQTSSRYERAPPFSNRSSMTLKKSLSEDDSRVEPLIMVVEACDESLDEILKKALSEGSVVILKRMEQSPTTSELLKTAICREELKDQEYMMSKHQVEFNCNFKLYLTTSLSLAGVVEEEINHLLLRTICFNMQPDKQGMEQHFMEKIVSSEYSELQLQHQRVQLDVHFMKREKKEIQTSVLKKVTDMLHGLYEDKDFFEYIASKRENLWLTEEKMFELQEFSNNIEIQRNYYQPLVSFLSTVHETLQNVSRVNPIYQFNMPQLDEIIDLALRRTPPTEQASAGFLANVEKMKEIVVNETFQKTCVVLSQEHSLLFPICVVLEQIISDLNITSRMIERFLLVERFESSVEKAASNTSSHIIKPDWITEESWSNFVELSQSSEKFEELLESLQYRSAEWEEYFQSNVSPLMTPYLVPELNTFEVALLWIAYDRNVLPSICEEFVLCQLGPDYFKVPAFHYSVLNTYPYRIQMIVLPDSNAPIVKDPYEMLLEAAKHLGIGNVTTVCMGGDEKQFEHAEQLICEAALNNSWVVIQNCHLVKKWSKRFLAKLETLLLSYKEKQSALGDHFRVWMLLRWNESLRLPERILKKSQIVAWQPLKDAEGIDTLYEYQSARDVNRTMLKDFTKEINRNKHGYYSTQYQLSNREFSSMVNLRNKLKQERTTIDSLSRVVKDAILLPQINNECDEKLYQLQPISERQTTMRHFNMVDVYFTMLRSYFNLVAEERPLCNVKRIEEISHIFRSMKDKFLSNKQTRCNNRPAVFEVVHEEMMECETLIEKIIKDFLFVQRALQCDCPYTERTLFIHREVTNGDTPLDWLRKSSQMYPDDAFPNHTKASSEKRIPLDSFVKSLNEKLMHYNEVINTPLTDPVKLDLEKFVHPANLLNAVRLQHFMETGKMEDLQLSSNDWIAKIFTEEDIALTKSSPSCFIIKGFKVFKTAASTDNSNNSCNTNTNNNGSISNKKLALPALFYLQRNEGIGDVINKTIEVYHNSLSNSRLHLFTLGLCERDDREDLPDNDILIFQSSTF